MASIKGFLFTIGFLLFSVSLLSFIVIILATNYQEDKRASEIGAIDRINTLDSSAQNSLKKIFEFFSNINVSLDDSDVENVKISDALPNNINTFRTSLNDFKIFVEQNFPYISLNTSELNETVPLTLLPDRISYYHSNADNNMLNKIIVRPEELSPSSRLKGYHFIITNLVSTVCVVPDIYVSGLNFIVNIDAFGNPNCNKNFVIDPDEINKFFIGASPDFFTIEIKNGGVATIENNQGGVANITTILLLDDSPGNQTKVMLPDSIIRISEPSLNIYKKGTARILWFTIIKLIQVLIKAVFIN